VIPLHELATFMIRRARLDTPQAFGARMARFGLIAAHMVPRAYRAAALRRSGKVQKRLVRGSHMLLNPLDPGISTDLLLDGIREPLITEAFQRLLRPGDVVMDCGANIGYYALQEAVAVGSIGKVYAIEPVPANADILGRNARLNLYDNVEVHRMAMGDTDRADHIYISSMSNMCTMAGGKGWRRFVDRVPVQVTTVDSFIDMVGRTPDVIRMDVEGYEVNVVNGMGRLLALGEPLRLFIEVHFDILLGRVVPMLEKLRDNGFRVAVATFEPHAAIRRSPLYPVVRWLEGVMGARSGYLELTMADLINDPVFRTGQVEDLEVIFER